MKFVADREGTVFSFLQLKFNISSTKIKNWLKHGYVKMDHKVITNPNHILVIGKSVEFLKPKFRKEDKGIWFKGKYIKIHYEDRDIIVVEKPTGLLSVGHAAEKIKTFINLVSGHLLLKSRGKENAFIVHRLDREVSGIMIFAKSSQNQKILQENWESTIKKYLALVENAPSEKEGVIDSKLKENRSYKVYTDNNSVYAKRSITHYKVIKSFKKHTLLEVSIKTGRKNQIRAHLSEIRCPIVGDKKYGSMDRSIKRLALHAFYLQFLHPRTKEKIEIKSSIPSKFSQINKKSDKREKK